MASTIDPLLTLAQPDPSKSTIHNLLNTFKSDPTCTKDQRVFSKREALSPEASEALDKLLEKRARLSDMDLDLAAVNATEYKMLEELLDKRQSSATLTKTQEQTLISLLAAAFIAFKSGGGSSQQVTIRSDFDSTLGDTLKVNAQSFIDQFALFPSVDPNVLTESLMCQGTAAGDFLKAAKAQKQNSCQAQCDCSCTINSKKSKRGLHRHSHTAKKNKRVIQQGWDHYVNGPDEEPNVETILHGIVENNRNTLDFMYSRLIQFQQGQEGIIELAWHINENGGGSGSNSNDPNTYRYVRLLLCRLFESRN